jgi:hypothetical protein
MFAVDALTQLPDDLLLLTDKMTMAASIECRVPCSIRISSISRLGAPTASR